MIDFSKPRWEHDENGNLTGYTGPLQQTPPELMLGNPAGTDKTGRSLLPERWEELYPGKQRCSKMIAMNEFDDYYEEGIGRVGSWGRAGSWRCNEVARYRVETTGRLYCMRCLPWNVQIVQCLRCGVIHHVDECCGFEALTGLKRGARPGELNTRLCAPDGGFCVLPLPEHVVKPRKR